MLATLEGVSPERPRAGAGTSTLPAVGATEEPSRREALARGKGKWANVFEPAVKPPPPKETILHDAEPWMLAVLVPLDADGLPTSFARALRAYESTARDGNAACNAGMGTLNLFGWGVPQNYRKAKEFFNAAADRSHYRGQTGKGILLANGWGVDHDYPAAFRWLHMGAAQGDPLAKYELGRMYYYKRGCSLDFRKAVSWWEGASHTGYAVAQYQLGQVYQHGTMVHPQQLEKALRLFTQASQQGYTLADPAIKWVEHRLWSPDLEGQLRRAKMKLDDAEENLKVEVERRQRESRRAQAAEAHVERLEERLMVELEIQRDLKRHLTQTQKRLEIETQRAITAEVELATKKSELKVTRNQLAEARKKILALKDRVEFLLAELRRRQHKHTDVGGKWEGAWVPRAWDDEWAPAGGAIPATFLGRWTCCDCTNPDGHYCKPFCGCGEVTGRFCKAPPIERTGTSGLPARSPSPHALH